MGSWVTTRQQLQTTVDADEDPAGWVTSPRRRLSPGAYDTWLARGLLAATIPYLLPFVTRWWIPFDEGMIGQTAERVLRGDLPHIDFQEPYSGGLSWAYALVFRVWGIELAHVRWFLFAGVLLAIVLVYDILRRYLTPVGAAVATWIALAWSFPNYFAGLPSWWLLICAIVAIWGFCRFEDSGSLWPLCLSALATGASLAVKQTGVYLVIAFATSIVYGRAVMPALPASVPQWVRRAAGASSLAVAVVIISGVGGGAAEYVFLLLPIAAVSIAVFIARDEPGRSLSLSHLGVIAAAGALPLILLVAPYAWRGELAAFVKDVALQPQSRLAFAHVGLPPAVFILSAPPVLMLLTGQFDRWTPRHQALCWIAAVTLLAASVTVYGYHIIWQSTRAAAALLPVIVCWRLHKVGDGAERRIQLFAASMLAWLSMNQVPFAHPVYFCYVAPVAVISAVCYGAPLVRHRETLLPWAMVLVGFGVLVINRGTLDNLGRQYPTPRPVVALDLPRAHLSVFPVSAHAYQAIVGTVNQHLGHGGLMAAPDCPELFFLTGQVNPTGSVFDFLDGTERHLDERAWQGRDVIVINHAPAFSPPMPESFVSGLRSEYPSSSDVGPFEIRWRQ